MDREKLLELAGRLDRADAAYNRVLAMPEGGDVSDEATGLAGAMVLTIHGHLFAEAAARIEALAAENERLRSALAAAGQREGPSDGRENHGG